MKNLRPLALLAAVSLAGCGGGGGGGSVSLGGPSQPAAGGGGTPAPSTSPISSEPLTQDMLSRQFSGSIQYLSENVQQAQQDQAEEVYAPDTQSSLARAFVQAGQAEVVTGRTGSAYLIGDTTYGVAQAAQDFLAGAGLASDAYTFVDTGEGQTNRSAYLGTQENSVVNILSSPLYTSSSSGGLGGLIISPEDVNAHGWIISDTGFDGNIDPIAGISGRAWLGENSASVAAGYRNALATGKVRLFYGLNADGESRNSSSNGCQGVEDQCIGTPYSLRIRNAEGSYIDVEGSFVSTYGFAAYVMAWERMESDTHISEVFAMGDACTVDLGETGADADTGLGRLDIGCLARRVYESQQPPVTVTAPQPVPVVVTPPATTSVAPPVVDETPTDDPVVQPPPVDPVDPPQPPVTVTAPQPVPVVVTPPATTSVAPPVVDETPTEPVIQQPVVDETPTDPVIQQPVVAELPDGTEKVTYWDREIGLGTLKDEFGRLGLTVTVDRKESSHMIAHLIYRYSCPDPFEFWLYRYEYLRVLHNSASVGETPTFEWDFMEAIGLPQDVSYTHLAVGSMEQDMNYDDVYRQTAENSLVHFETNPFYLGGPRARWYWGWDWGMDKETWLDPDLVPDHGWIVSETGFDVQYANARDGDDFHFSRHRHRRVKITDYRGEAPDNYHPDHQADQQAQIKESYDKALATGKVRLFYGLNSDQNGRDPQFLDCTDFEEYCIGVPYPYNSHYGFGIYLMSWERLPEAAHISAVFDMGDRCTEDLGADGPDADTGLGRLDIGCMAYEVYKVNLDPESATLTVAARTRSQDATTISSSSLLTVEGGNVQLQAHSAPPSVSGADDGAAQQQFFNDFAQELFSHLGSLWLPGSTQAGFSVGFPGDSFEGTYRPTHGVGTHYDVEAPSPRYALSGGSVGVMGTASGEAGIFTRIEGMDISFSYARSEDFFGGQGSGDFGFASVGNSRLMVQRQMLAGTDDHSLVLGGWVRHAAVAGGKGRLLDDLRGSEYGLSMNYGWQRSADGLKVEATAYAARFAGGEVELAGGNRFAIGASDWQWGVRIGGSYEF